MRYYTLVILALFVLPGCSTVVDTYSDTVDGVRDVMDDTMYTKTHEIQEYGLDDPHQEKLARLMAPVDGPLGSLLRYVSTRDEYPDETWVEVLFSRYPWISTMFIADKDGWMLDRYPNEPLKRIREPLQFEAYWRKTHIQTRVDYPELGPELYISTPIFNDSEFSGLIVVSLDPRALFNFCPEPDKLIIMHPGGGVWTQDKSVDKAGLQAVDWADILEDDVQGVVDVGDREYTWVARYVGTEPYLYATLADAEED